MSISRETFNIVGGMIVGVSSLTNGIGAGKGLVFVLGVAGVSPVVSVPLAVIFGVAGTASLGYLGMRAVAEVSNLYCGSSDVKSSARASPLASPPYRR
jgi:hypothetical protein